MNDNFKNLSRLNSLGSVNNSSCEIENNFTIKDLNYIKSSICISKFTRFLTNKKSRSKTHIIELTGNKISVYGQGSNKSSYVINFNTSKEATKLLKELFPEAKIYDITLIKKEVELMRKIASDIFDKNMVPIRVSGKINLVSGYKEKYKVTSNGIILDRATISEPYSIRITSNGLVIYKKDDNTFLCNECSGLVEEVFNDLLSLHSLNDPISKIVLGSMKGLINRLLTFM